MTTPEGYSTKFTGRLHREVTNPFHFYMLHVFLTEKVPLSYTLLRIDPFHIPSLELCFPFNFFEI